MSWSLRVKKRIPNFQIVLLKKHKLTKKLVKTVNSVFGQNFGEQLKVLIISETFNYLRKNEKVIGTMIGFSHLPILSFIPLRYRYLESRS